MKKIRVLFVCLGNICRSPLAEAIFKEKVNRRNLDDFIQADSCGTSNYNIGDSPDPRTIANAKKNGVVAIDHCGRQLATEDLSDFDFILAMDNCNYQHILKLWRAEKFSSKVSLMRAYDPQGDGDVPDPFYGGEKNFQSVFDILDRSIEKFLDHVVQEHLKNPGKIT